MRLPSSAIAALIASCLVSGCSTGQRVNNACVLVLFDQSVGMQSTRDRYAADFAKVVAKLEGGDTILGDVITEDTHKTASFPIDQDIPRFDAFKDDELGYKAKLARTKKDLLKKTEELLAVRAANSDILSGFRLAEKVFSGDKGLAATHRVLIVFTDAIEQTPEYDFTAMPDYSEKEIEQIISAQKSHGRLPDLSGVRIYMVGVNAMATPQASMTPEKTAWTEEFWLAYAAATKASLDKADYSPSLINLTLR